MYMYTYLFVGAAWYSGLGLELGGGGVGGALYPPGPYCCNFEQVTLY